MKRTHTLVRVSLALATGLASLASANLASAHVMVSQHGTLRVADGGAFVVASVPVSAFRGVDDDGDGRLSQNELNLHRGALAAQIHRGFQLHDSQGARPLQGLVINLSLEHGAAQSSTDQIVFMGRFGLASSGAPLRLAVSLFGHREHERTLEIRASRGSNVRVLVFTPPERRQRLFG